MHQDIGQMDMYVRYFEPRFRDRKNLIFAFYNF